MISSLLHLVGLRPRVYYTLTNFRGGGQGPLAPPSIRQCINTLDLVRASGATQQLWLLRIISSFFLSSKKLSIVVVRRVAGILFIYKTYIHVPVCLSVCLSVRLTIFWQIHMYASELFKIYINLLHHAITQ